MSESHFVGWHGVNSFSPNDKSVLVTDGGHFRIKHLSSTKPRILTSKMYVINPITFMWKFSPGVLMTVSL